MTAKVGKYHFGRHRSTWGIWVVKETCNGAVMSCFFQKAFTYEEAVRETYRLNGWGEPKRIYKKY